MGVLAWIVIGLVAGWLAAKIVDTRRGLFRNLIVGLIGSVLGGFLFEKLDKRADSVAATIDDGKGGTQTLTVERVISAVGVTGNIENLGLENSA